MANMPHNKVNYVDFLKTVGRSKRLLRSGWVREKVKDPESVAEHSFRVGVLAMIFADKLGYKLNKEKLMKMALLHDLGEVITEDTVIERWDMVDLKKREEKEQKEREGIKKIFGKIDEAGTYLALYDEMIGRTSDEAQVFWQLDKLEMALQALEYEDEQGKSLEEFFVNASLTNIRDSLLKETFEKILKSRKGGK